MRNLVIITVLLGCFPSICVAQEPQNPSQKAEVMRVFASLSVNGQLEVNYIVYKPVIERRERVVPLPDGSKATEQYTVTRMVAESRVMLLTRFEAKTIAGQKRDRRALKKAMAKGKVPILLLKSGARLSEHDRVAYRQDLLVVRILEPNN